MSIYSTLAFIELFNSGSISESDGNEFYKQTSHLEDDDEITKAIEDWLQSRPDLLQVYKERLRDLIASSSTNLEPITLGPFGSKSPTLPSQTSPTARELLDNAILVKKPKEEKREQKVVTNFGEEMGCRIEMNEQEPNETNQDNRIQVYSPRKLGLWPFSRGKTQMTQPLSQSALIFLQRANASNTPSEVNQWLELSIRTNALSLNESQDKQLLMKVSSANNPAEASTWLDVYEREVTIREKTKQNQFSNYMTVLFFLTGIAGVTTGAILSIPVVGPVGGFLIGASSFKIVPDYVSKVIEKISLKNLVLNGQKVSFNEGDGETKQ
jgi:hypothetical protein